MTSIEEYKALGVGGRCPQCEVEAAKVLEETGIPLDDCGHLVIKNGRYGEFIACSDRCGYTRSIPGRSVPREPPKKGICPTCKGTDYIPFVKPDGTVSQYAQVVCPDCGGYDHEQSYADANIPDRQLEDFDFPCSYTWRSFYEEQATGNSLPLLEAEDRPVLEQVIVHRHSDMRKLDWDLLQQTAKRALYLEKQLANLANRPGKPGKRYIQYKD